MCKIKIRHIIGVMIFLGYFFIYVVRYNMSVHIVDMANIPELAENENDSAYFLKLERSGDVTDLMNWDDLKISRLFSAYHIGFCVCFPLFHTLGDRLGPTWVAGIAGIISGILNCLTPPSAYSNFWSLFVIRILIGFCAGAMQPSMVQVLRNWVPPVERNHFVWVYCGITIGTFSSLVFCAVIQFYSRWSRGFYVAGGVQVAWALLWLFLVTDRPDRQACISSEEVTYLNDAIGTAIINRMNARAPWLIILKSKAFWMLCILNFGYAWMIIAISLYGPLYYSRVVRYSIYSGAMLTALPFLLRLILGYISSHALTWYAQTAKAKPIKNLRKYFVVVSHVLPGAMITVMWLTPAHPGPIMLTTAVAMTAAGMDLILELCYLVLPIWTWVLFIFGSFPKMISTSHEETTHSFNKLLVEEITPSFANSIYTVIKIIGTTPGILISYGVGATTYAHTNSLPVWKHIWCFHALVLCLSGVLFLLWGETSAQPWTTAVSRPYRKRTLQRPSIMSNISEADESERNSSSRPSQIPQTYKSFFSSAPLRISRQRTHDSGAQLKPSTSKT